MNGGRTSSFRPRYYGSCSRYPAGCGRFQMRPPVWLGAGVAVGFMFYASGAQPKCLAYPNTFQFGGKCRDCSNWECPIGQYRVPCTASTDSYCKPCTNRPSSLNSAYVTPGNDNDCLSAPCGSGTNVKVIDSPLLQLSCFATSAPQPPLRMCSRP
jgi:hypothetical protein